MSINVNVGNIIPTNVVEVGNEISADQLAAITSAVNPSAVNPFSTNSHTHTIASIPNLQAELDSKVSVAHTHAISEVVNLQNILDSKSGVAHTHTIGNITGLPAALAEKSQIDHTHAGLYAPIYHNHEISHINNLQNSLDSKANSTHTHTIANVSGLQSALDNKANTTHTHDNYALISHNHQISAIIGLQSALDAKTNIGHLHTIANITGLQNALDTKSSIGHTHSGYALLTGAIFSGDIAVPKVRNLLNESLIFDIYNDTGAGTNFLHSFNPVDGRFYLASNGGGLVFPDLTIQSTASYSKAQSDAHLQTVATWVNTKADWGHTHVINDITDLQASLNSKVGFPLSWIEGGDIARQFTITNGNLSWDNTYTIGCSVSGIFNFNSGATFNGKVSTKPSDSTSAYLNLGIGVTPSNPQNGDIWIDNILRYRTANTSVVVAGLAIDQTFSQPQAFDSNSNTKPALRVTQRGTGEAFRVEDSTSPDSTAFIISNDGKVGIGQNVGTALSADLDIIKRSSSWAVNIDASSAGGNGLGVLVTGYSNFNTALQVNNGCARFEGGASFGLTEPVVSRISTPVIATGTYNREIEMVIGGSTFRIPCRQV